MLAGEVDPSVAQRRRRFDRADEPPRAARPLVFDPTLRRAVFEVRAQSGEDRIELVQRGRDTFALLQRGDSLSLAGTRVGHQYPARTRLAPGRLPDLDRAFRESKSVESVLFPEAIFRLQVNARD